MFDKKIKAHLAAYKVNVLGVVENGRWWKNKKEYDHILPDSKSVSIKNVIDKGFQKEIFNLISVGKLHQGFHHLNSSQALALNLFGPLVVERKLSIIGRLLQVEKIGGNAKSEFEYVENSKEYTNFDYFIEGPSNIYFEVKYTESHFNRAPDDEKHKDKYEKVYKENLDKITSIKMKQFFDNYQLWRNILYSEKGYVVFVIPKFREDLKREIEKTIMTINNRAKVKILFIDDIVNECKKIKAFIDHYTEFEKKYLKFE